MNLEAPFRAATPDDAVAMAKLVNIAGEGLAAHQWERLAGPGETAWDLGQQRARRETGGFSYRNTVLVDVDGEVRAALIGYPLSEVPEPVNYDELPPMFAPLQELEDEVPGTWYVNVLAAFPEHRGKGYGGALLTLAESLARDAGCRGMSLIVSDANAGARRLYERVGYVERGTRPMVKEDWQNPGQNWVLLVKPF